jgi:hypothetical protein
MSHCVATKGMPGGPGKALLRVAQLMGGCWTIRRRSLRWHGRVPFSHATSCGDSAAGAGETKGAPPFLDMIAASQV